MNCLSSFPERKNTKGRIKRSREGKTRCISNHRDKSPMTYAPPRAAQA
jgi:hypothetical protein